MPPDVKTLCRQIDAAFGALPYPGDDAIVAPDMQDDPEALEVRRAFAGKHWRDVPFDALEQVSWALPFLSPVAYQFYLPAFLTFALIDYQRANPVPHEVVQSLLPPSSRDLEGIRALAELHPDAPPFSEAGWSEALTTLERGHASGVLARDFLARATRLDQPQAAAVLTFLEHVRECHGEDFPNGEPTQAIDRHWRTAASTAGHR